MVDPQKQLDDAPQGVHVIEVSLDGGYPRLKAICRSEPGARCRLVCSEFCGNEYIPCYSYDEDADDERRPHELVVGGDCNVELFLNEGDIEELCASSKGFSIEVPIDYEWGDETYLWSPKQEEATNGKDQASQGLATT